MLWTFTPFALVKDASLVRDLPSFATTIFIVFVNFPPFLFVTSMVVNLLQRHCVAIGIAFHGIALKSLNTTPGDVTARSNVCFYSGAR